MWWNKNRNNNTKTHTPHAVTVDTNMGAVHFGGWDYTITKHTTITVDGTISSYSLLSPHGSYALLATDDTGLNWMPLNTNDLTKQLTYNNIPLSVSMNIDGTFSLNIA